MITALTDAKPTGKPAGMPPKGGKNNDQSQLDDPVETK